MQWKQKSTTTTPTTKPRSRPPQPQREPRQGGKELERPSHKGKSDKSAERKPRKLSHLKKPPEMSLEDWQVELRRQFGREQNFRLKNVGDQPIFSEFEVTNPQTQRHLPRGHPRPDPGDNYCSCPDFATNTLGTCKHIEFTLAAPGAEARPCRAASQPATSRRTARSSCSTAPAARCVSGPAAPARCRLARLAGRLLRRRRPPAARGLRPLRGRSWPRPGKLDHELRCYDDVLAFVAEVRDAEQRQRRVAEAFPRGIQQRRLQGPAAGAALRLSARGRPVRRPGRPLPDRRRDGPGQDDPGHRRRRDPGPHSFGVERVLIVCPTSLKHQWQREIETLHRPPGAGRRRPAAAPRRPAYAADVVLQDHQLRHGPPRPRPDRALGARPGHPRRGPAHQELEHAHRPQRQAHRSRPTPSC